LKEIFRQNISKEATQFNINLVCYCSTVPENFKQEQ